MSLLLLSRLRRKSFRISANNCILEAPQPMLFADLKSAFGVSSEAQQVAPKAVALREALEKSLAV
jgi:hypothetical protein